MIHSTLSEGSSSVGLLDSRRAPVFRAHAALRTLAVGGVLALAAFLRLGWPGINSFSFDESRLSWLALHMARSSEWATVGMQSSASVPNMPAAVWIFALPYLFTSNPLYATLFVGLLGTLAVAGLWWVAHQTWGFWGGLTTGLLFAASPWAVWYSRGIWAQDLLPPLAVLWAMAGILAARKGSSLALALHVFLAGFAPQVHYAGATLVIGTLWLVLVYRLWRHWPALLIGAVLAGLAAWPFLYTAWHTPSLWVDMRSALSRSVSIDLSGLRHLVGMGIGLNWESPLLGNWVWPQPWSALSTLATLATALLILAGGAIVIRQVWRVLRRRERKETQSVALLIPVWACCAPLLFLIHKTPVYRQYQLAALPALFLAAGATSGLLQKHWWGPAITSLTLGVAVIWSVLIIRGLKVAAQQETPGGIGTPLAYPAKAAQSLSDGERVVVHTYGDETAYQGDAAGFDVLLWDYPHGIVDGRSALLLPGSGQTTHLLMTFADLPAWEEALLSGLQTVEQTLPRREGEPSYMALTVTGGDPEGFQATTEVTLASGARLRGWRVRLVDGHMRLETWWTIVGPLTGESYHQFNHLYTAEAGDPLEIHDVSVSSQAWQVGNHLITWVDFDQPDEAGPYWLDVGMYTYPQLKRSPSVDREGDPLAAIRLGPFEWPE